jgi:hypothetical protein
MIKSATMMFNGKIRVIFAGIANPNVIPLHLPKVGDFPVRHVDKKNIFDYT